MSKHSIIKGTLILTVTGFITRIIGFFYRIILSNALGARNMGVYQLIFPVYGICFTLFASGIQTSISRLVAAQTGIYGEGHNHNITRILRVGLICSLSIACSLSGLVYLFGNFIAGRLLSEPSCAEGLRMLSLAFPFCGITSCINGYYYGMKKTSVPASTQLIEQITRVIFVLAISYIVGDGNTSITCEMAVLGLVMGELTSCTFNVLNLYRERNKHYKSKKTDEVTIKREQRVTKMPHIFRELLKQAVPLTSNRLLLSVLNSIEAVLIPIMLRQSGLSVNEALSIYGILIGMSIPFILFPSAIPNSFSVLLLPAISEAQAKSNHSMIERTTSISIKYCLLIGVLSTGFFVTFGRSLGMVVYHNAMSGSFIVSLAWLCPFLYLTTTLSSIINGLGKAQITFFNSIIGVVIRILVVIFIIPQYGIYGYLTGNLISQLCITILDYTAVSRHIHLKTHFIDWLIKPGIIVALLGFIFSLTYERLASAMMIHPSLVLLLCAIGFCSIYLLILKMAGIFTTKELT